MNYLIAIVVIFGVVVGGIAVERFYRRFANSNPQLGPFRPPGKQDCCSCVAGSGCAEPTDCTKPQVAKIEFR